MWIIVRKAYLLYIRKSFYVYTSYIYSINIVIINYNVILVRYNHIVSRIKNNIPTF